MFLLYLKISFSPGVRETVEEEIALSSALWLPPWEAIIGAATAAAAAA